MLVKEERLYKNWWLLLIKGVIISTYGIIFLFKLFGFKLLIQSFIIISIVNGILILYGSFHYRKNNLHWIYWFIEGTFDFLFGVAGIILIMAMEVLSYLAVNLFIIQIIAFWALVHGIIHTFSANKVKNYVPSAKIALFSGVGIIVLAITIIALAIIVFLKPIFFSLPDYYFIGWFCIVIGVLLSLISIILRKTYSD